MTLFSHMYCSPDKRITAAQALSHPYFAGLYSPRDEPMQSAPLPAYPEIDTMAISGLRRAILQEMARNNPDLLCFVQHN